MQGEGFAREWGEPRVAQAKDPRKGKLSGMGTLKVQDVWVADRVRGPPVHAENYATSLPTYGLYGSIPYGVIFLK